MKRKLALLTTLVLVCLLLLPVTALADKGDLDEIVKYNVTVTPNAADGSLSMTTAVDWKVLDEGPLKWVKIGVPNGSITNLTANTSSIDHLEFDSSYIYVYFDRNYDEGETVRFSYSWVQSYMYSLDGGKVSFNYTPGWFDDACVDEMSVTWNAVAGATGSYDFSVSGGTSSQEDNTAAGGAYTVKATGLEHGARIGLNAVYAAWPVSLDSGMSKDNMPSDYEGGYGDYYSDYSSGFDAIISGMVVLAVIVIFVVIVSINSRHSWAGGFGTRYVFVNGLYYPRGRDGRPRPGSVGTPHRPTPPPSHSSGIGGGRGGFGGGGGIGGGGHCACASSCACACACACAGGGRAGCSAKNLYGAIHMKDELPLQKSEKPQ